MFDKKINGERLRRLRGDKTREEVCTATGIGISALSMYENGERSPRDDIKEILASYYNTTVGALFFNERVHSK